MLRVKSTKNIKWKVKMQQYFFKNDGKTNNAKVTLF